MKKTSKKGLRTIIEETFPFDLQQHIAAYLDSKSLCFFAASSKHNLQNVLPLLLQFQEKLLSPPSFLISHHCSTWLCHASAIYVCGSSYLDGNGLGLQRRYKNDPFKQVTTLTGNIRQIALSDGHELILMEDQTLWGCGCNEQGQLGLGYFSKQETLKQLQGIEGKILQIAVGNSYSFVLSDRGLWASGANNFGPLGLGYDSFTHIHGFERVTGFEGTPLQIATGEHHTVILTDKGLWACGSNNSGQLGLGHNKDCHTFQPVTGVKEKILKIVAGSDYTIIITEQDLWACGDNNSGQLGLGHTRDCNTFQRVISLSGKILQVSPGRFHTLVLTDEGPWICGSNNSGQLGLELPIDRECYCSIFQRVKCIKGRALQVMAGCSSSLILSDQGLWACGENIHAELGLEFDAGKCYINKFKLVKLLPQPFKQLLSLYRHIDQLKAVAGNTFASALETKNNHKRKSML